MFRLEVSKKDIITDRVVFDTFSELTAFVEKAKDNHYFGRNERYYIIKDISEIPENEDIENIKEIQDIDTRDGQRQKYIFKADYDLIITDISVEAEELFKRKLIRKSMLLGQDLIAEVAFINIKNNRSSKEIVELMSLPEVGILIHLLQTGALSSAKTMIGTFDSPLFSSEDKKIITDKIDAFFNSFII